MQVSLIGVVICAGIVIAAYYMRGLLVIGLLASLAFGATAIVTIGSLGGSSPLIFTCFAALLVFCAALRPRILRDLGEVYGSMPIMWVVSLLLAYAAVGAWLFPRLFAGQTMVFVQSEQRGGVVAVALAPVSSNISQTGYFIMGGMTCLAICLTLLHEDKTRQLRRGFFLWCGLTAGMGLIDLLGKLVGMGDVLGPIRTASYSMLTDVRVEGFARITGAHSEASGFGAVSLACLAFSYTYWRRTASRLSLVICLLLLALELLSTSSTAYVGLAALSIPVMLAVARSLLNGRLARQELAMIAASGVLLVTAIAISLGDLGLLDSVSRLVDTMIFDKSLSSSGQERAYWNAMSLQALFDTSGLGVGFGSSRASSWPIALVSQLGVLGAVLMALLLLSVARGLGRLQRWLDPETVAVVASVKAAGLASIVGASVSGGNADPGMIFFISLAAVSASRARARNNMGRAAARLDGQFQVASGVVGQAAGLAPGSLS